MKKLLSLSFLFSGLSWGEIEVPRHVYTIDKLEEAQALATEKEKPLLFVFTSLGHT